jgi:hypothetical protein
MVNFCRNPKRVLGVAVGVLALFLVISRLAPWSSLFSSLIVVVLGSAFAFSATVRERIVSLLRLDPTKTAWLSQRLGIATFLGCILFLFAAMGIRSDRADLARAVAEQTANAEVAAHLRMAQDAITAERLDDAGAALIKALAVKGATNRDSIKAVQANLTAVRRVQQAISANQDVAAKCDVAEINLAKGEPDAAARDLDSALHVPFATELDRPVKLLAVVREAQEKHLYQAAIAAIEEGQFDNAETKLRDYLKNPITQDRDSAEKYLRAIEVAQSHAKARAIVKSLTTDELATLRKSSKLPAGIDPGPEMKQLSEALVIHLTDVADAEQRWEEAQQKRADSATAAVMATAMEGEFGTFTVERERLLRTDPSSDTSSISLRQRQQIYSQVETLRDNPPELAEIKHKYDTSRAQEDALKHAEANDSLIQEALEMLCAKNMISRSQLDAITWEGDFRQWVPRGKQSSHSASSKKGSSPAASASQKLEQDVDAFRRRLERTGIIGSVVAEVSVSNTLTNKHRVVITVTRAWHAELYQERLQAAQNLWKIWATLHAPSELDIARIKLQDLNGNEVGGSRVIAGSAIWVNK